LTDLELPTTGQPWDYEIVGPSCPQFPAANIGRLAKPGLGPTNRKAHVAQLVEHVLGKDEVTGSIPVMGSIAGQSGEQPVRRQFRKIAAIKETLNG
jgi:hypothetical protein